MRAKLLISLLLLAILSAAGRQTAEMHECKMKNVRVFQPDIFQQIDSIVNLTDILVTIKPKVYNPINEDIYALVITDVTSDTVLSDGRLQETMWIRVDGVKKNVFLGKYYFSINGRYIVSDKWLPQLYKSQTGKIKYFSFYPFSGIIYEGTPIWLFQINDGKVVQAYYTYDESDDFRTVVYDILNDRVVSEGDNDEW